MWHVSFRWLHAAVLRLLYFQLRKFMTPHCPAMHQWQRNWKLLANYSVSAALVECCACWWYLCMLCAIYVHSFSVRVVTDHCKLHFLHRRQIVLPFAASVACSHPVAPNVKSFDADLILKTLFQWGFPISLHCNCLYLAITYTGDIGRCRTDCIRASIVALVHSTQWSTTVAGRIERVQSFIRLSHLISCFSLPFFVDRLSGSTSVSHWNLWFSYSN